jgi:hypothetical protein
MIERTCALLRPTHRGQHSAHGLAHLHQVDTPLGERQEPLRGSRRSLGGLLLSQKSVYDGTVYDDPR